MRTVFNGDDDDSKIWTVTETKTVEVKFFPSPNCSFVVTSHHHPDAGFSVCLRIQKANGNYEEYSDLSREELLKLANSLLELAK